MKVLSRFLKLFYEPNRDGLTPLTQDEYVARLLADSKKAKKAFEKAWAIRNFEIEMYWKRATYFWAFIASAFLGYFGLVNSANYKTADPSHHSEVFIVICLGLVLSMAWHFTNRGSKQWQRHWEIHVDLLEDNFTGPLYKTVHPARTYSVSKINDIVSAAISAAWFLLGAKYFVDQNLVHLRGQLDWIVAMSLIGTVATLASMTLGYGRGRFGARDIRMFSRSATYSDDALPTVEKTNRDLTGPPQGVSQVLVPQASRLTSGNTSSREC